MTTVSSAQAVGIVGVGRMGLAMCARLAQQGFGVVATDVRPEARAEVIAAGGSGPTPSPRSPLARRVVITRPTGTA